MSATRGMMATCALAVSVVLLGACSTGSVGSDPGNPDQVEVLTRWASGNEEPSYNTLIRLFERDHPGIEFIDASIAGRDGVAARAALALRLEAGNPPDVFQTAGGAELEAYAEAGVLTDLTGWYDDGGMDGSVVEPSLLDLISHDERLFAVPTNVHRVNVLWTDTSLLVSAGLDPDTPPTSLQAWLADLEVIRGSGVEYPLALGDAWTQLQLFESVLLAELGAEQYRELWVRPSTWKNDKVRRAVDLYGQLLEFTDPASRSFEWNVVVEQVVQSRAAYAVMIDLADISFVNAGLSDGRQYTSSAVPGTNGIYDLHVDVFVVPSSAVHQSSAQFWLQTVGEVEAQEALSERKGSLPARTDTANDGFSVAQNASLQSLHHDEVVPSLAHGVAASPTWTDAISGAVVEFGLDGRKIALLLTLIAAADRELS